jgi:hypothetical protein
MAALTQDDRLIDAAKAFARGVQTESHKDQAIS